MTLILHAPYEYPQGEVALDSFPVAADVARMVMSYSQAVETGVVQGPPQPHHPEIVGQTVAVADYRRDRALCRAPILTRAQPPLPQKI